MYQNSFCLRIILLVLSVFIRLGVEDVSWRMSRCWIRELTGMLKIIFTGSLRCSGTRDARSFYMEMLNLRPRMLFYRFVYIWYSISVAINCRSDTFTYWRNWALIRSWLQTHTRFTDRDWSIIIIQQSVLLSLKRNYLTI